MDCSDANEIRVVFRSPVCVLELHDAGNKVGFAIRFDDGLREVGLGRGWKIVEEAVLEKSILKGLCRG